MNHSKYFVLPILTALLSACGGDDDASSSSSQVSSQVSSNISSSLSSSMSSSSMSISSSSMANSSANSSSSNMAELPAGLEGFATVYNGSSYNFTGGAGGQVVDVYSFDTLAQYLQDDEPRTIYIHGTLSTDSVDMIDVGSNKSIIGVGADATIDGFGFNISGSYSTSSVVGCDAADEGNDFNRQNVLIQNLTFINSRDDSVNIQCWAHNIWIDHNTFTKSYDGSVDIKRGADFVTVSWNKYEGTSKTMLLGHSDGNGDQDRGHLRVSYHHNYFVKSAQRNPRVRFGRAHVYNNYVVHISSYFIGLGVEANVYADGNYIEFADAISESYGGGDLTWHSSNIVEETDNQAEANGQAFNPRDFYSYNLDSAASLPSLISAQAGAGKLNVSGGGNGPSSSSQASSTSSATSSTASSQQSSQSSSNSSIDVPPMANCPARPQPTETVQLDGTVVVNAGETYDGQGKRYNLSGGSQDEGQPPLFRLEDGAKLVNVVIGNKAADGVHCYGSCLIENVWWEDIGEDAATAKGPAGSVMEVNCGGAFKGEDKVFQHNGRGEVRIFNFIATEAGKLYRSCGDCTGNGGPRIVTIENVEVYNVKTIVGINPNFGDAARIRNLTVEQSDSHKVKICQVYKGVVKGEGSTQALGVEFESQSCDVSPSDITLIGDTRINLTDYNGSAVPNVQ